MCLKKVECHKVGKKIVPYISVIVAVYNAKSTLQRCIDSVLDQVSSNIELIIVDGASTDGTLDIIKVNEDKIAYWESKPDRGIYHAWNKALEHVHGEWILFLGADDYLWDNDVLDHLSIILDKQSPNHTLVYSKVALVDAASKLLRVVGSDWEEAKRYANQEMVLPHQGLFHHVSIFNNGWFDEDFRIAGDFDLVLRALQTTEPYFASEFIVTAMTMGGVSNSVVGTFKCLNEFAKARKKHDIATDYFKLLKSYTRGVWLFIVHWLKKYFKKGY